MTPPRDDWDADEVEALAGLEAELAEIRRRHSDDPPLEMLRAADADVLPPELQARIAQHLQASPWSRALLDGVRDSGAEDRLEAADEDRILARITREARAASRPRWRPLFLAGGLALAATVLIAVMVSRPDGVVEQRATPSADVAAAAPPPPAAPSAAPVRIAFSKPEVKLSASALTWRGSSSTTTPFLQDLAPAFDAYRAGDYPLAVTRLDRLATTYPDSIEVSFYQGVSRMLAGDEAGAIPALEAAARLNSPTFTDDVAWYLAVARQRAGRPAALEAFDRLCRRKGAHAASACAAAEQLHSAGAVPR